MPQQYRGRARMGSTNVWRNLALTFIVLFVLMLFILAGVYSSVSSAQSNANYWQNQYYNLLSQYNNLQSQYNSLQSRYNSLLGLLGNDSWSGTLNPGYILYFYVFVPNGYVGTLRISVSSSATVLIYVFDPFQFACFWTSSCTYNYEYTTYGTNINSVVALSSGEYIFVVKNINNYPVQISASISTTYTPSS
jgi:hypothetical protein